VWRDPAIHSIATRLAQDIRRGIDSHGTYHIPSLRPEGDVPQGAKGSHVESRSSNGVTSGSDENWEGVLPILQPLSAQAYDHEDATRSYELRQSGTAAVDPRASEYRHRGTADAAARRRRLAGIAATGDQHNASTPSSLHDMTTSPSRRLLGSVGERHHRGSLQGTGGEAGAQTIDQVKRGRRLQGGSAAYAYEVDGLGGVLSDFDDPNLPSLLAMPIIGYPHYDPGVRKMLCGTV
jgi:hypothetical protein